MNTINVPASIHFSEGDITITLYGNEMSPDFKFELHLKSGEKVWNWIMLSHDDRIFASGDFEDVSEDDVKLGRILGIIGKLYHE